MSAVTPSPTPPLSPAGRGSRPRAQSGVIPRLRSFLSRFAYDTEGVSAIVVGLSLAVILGAAGLAVDVGLWYADRRAAQGAADSAAYSAAVDYSANSSVANATQTAQGVAAKYGFVNGVNNVTVAVYSPPSSGAHQTASLNAFEVIITKSEALFFSAIYINSASIRARAVAIPGAQTISPYCLQILDSRPGATNINFNATNGASIDLSACGIADNGPGSCAINASGAGTSIITQSLSVVGNYCTSNNATFSVTGSKTIGAAAVVDPYATLSLSSVEGSTNLTCPNSNPTSYSSGTTSNRTQLNAGVYCGLSISGNVNLNPGIYYVVGNTFEMDKNSSATGTGVTIVLTGSGNNYATTLIQNSASLDLTAPTTGSTAGLAFWADPASPTSSVSHVEGGSTMVVNGALYFPTQQVVFSNGTPTSTGCTQLIAYDLSFSSNATFTNNCANSGVKSIGKTLTQVVE